MFSLYNMQHAEQMLGPITFFHVYSLSGPAGNIVSYCKCPTASVGASGALFGVASASLVTLIDNRDYYRHEHCIDTSATVYNIAKGMAVSLGTGIVTPEVDNWCG
jgi:membrane associated rhomboid family serine protease